MIRTRILALPAATALIGAAALFPSAASAGGNVAWSVSVGGPGFAVTAGEPGFVGAPVPSLPSAALPTVLSARRHRPAGCVPPVVRTGRVPVPYRVHAPRLVAYARRRSSWPRRRTRSRGVMLGIGSVLPVLSRSDAASRRSSSIACAARHGRRARRTQVRVDGDRPPTARPGSRRASSRTAGRPPAANRSCAACRAAPPISGALAVGDLPDRELRRGRGERAVDDRARTRQLDDGQDARIGHLAGDLVDRVGVRRLARLLHAVQAQHHLHRARRLRPDRHLPLRVVHQHAVLVTAAGRGPARSPVDVDDLRAGRQVDRVGLPCLRRRIGRGRRRAAPSR